MKKRYFVDERGGCLAVCDRSKMDKRTNNWLHPDSRHVVRYWSGKFVREKCPTCNQNWHGQWTLEKSDIAEAHRLCEELNQKELEANIGFGI